MIPLRTALYFRTSTAHQTTENQQFELTRLAELRGWKIISSFQDEGVSGSKSRVGRPGLDALLRQAHQRKFDLLAVWSIDRLGRSLQHLVETVNDLHSVGVDIYIHQQAIDTITPAGKLAFSVFGALAEYERELIRERVRAGLDRAKREGVRLGRPTNLTDSVREAVLAARAQRIPIQAIAKQQRIGTATIYKVLANAEPAPTCGNQS